MPLKPMFLPNVSPFFVNRSIDQYLPPPPPTNQNN